MRETSQLGGEKVIYTVDAPEQLGVSLALARVQPSNIFSPSLGSSRTRITKGSSLRHHTALPDENWFIGGS
jgi:hypothetical protein